MKKVGLLGLLVLSGGVVSAQSISDVMKYSNHDIVGSARYMGMAGAFTALGGDISTLSQNPAGIGVYRSSEVVGTLSIGGVEASTQDMGVSPFNSRSGENVVNKFNLGVNNLGYVGTFMTGKRRGLISFNVGFAFNRQAGERKSYRIAQYDMRNGMSDYIADLTNQWAVANPDSRPGDLIYDPNSSYDPFFDSSAPWLSVLGYNNFVINNVANPDGSNQYVGLYSDMPGIGIGGNLEVQEKYRIDEYSFNFGGNVSNQVYWGIGVGIIDMSYSQRQFYDENYWDKGNPSSVNNFGAYYLDNFLNTSGTGVNVKAGLIVKPTRSLRLGAAVHTPTWYQMTDHFGAVIQSFDVPNFDNGGIANPDDLHTPSDFVDYRLRTPWRFQVGAAYVFGRYGILSFDYERVDYSFSHLSDADGNERGFDLANQDLSQQLSGQNTFKVGAEIRLTPVVSLRLGYANQSSGFADEVKENRSQVYASGTIPHYVVDLGSQYYTGGLGYRFGSFFADMAFVWKHNKQDGYLFPTAFSSTGENFVTSVPTEIKTSSYKFVLTAGYKF